MSLSNLQNTKYVVSQSLATSFNAPPIDCLNLYCYSITARVTNSAGLTGELKLQASNDYLDSMDDRVTASPTWVDIDGSEIAVTGDIDQLWNVDSVGYRWARMVWTSTSGTGTLNAQAHGKG